VRPTISIITATFNAAASLRHCLASVAEQTLSCEHIVIDGASTDGTLAIIGEHLSACDHGTADSASGAPHPSPLTRLVSEKDQGLYDALNKGLRVATGDIVGFLHADDFYPSPDILAKVAAIFTDPQVEACYGDLVYVREMPVERLNCAARVESSPAPPLNHFNSEAFNGAENVSSTAPEVPIQQGSFNIVRYWHSGPYVPQKFYHGWMPPHPTFFVRRSVYEQYGLFNCDLGTAADYELMLRLLLKHRINCVYLPEVLVCMRVGGASNRTLAARLRANRMDRMAWSVNGLRPYPWTLFFKPLRKVSQWWRRPPKRV
jgi:glycosyltransferase